MGQEIIWAGNQAYWLFKSTQISHFSLSQFGNDGNMSKIYFTSALFTHITGVNTFNVIKNVGQINLRDLN